jgi:hypothetical protein
MFEELIEEGETNLAEIKRKLCRDNECVKGKR